jgi:hypothetical protein
LAKTSSGVSFWEKMQHPVYIRGIAEIAHPQFHELLDAFNSDCIGLAIGQMIDDGPHLGHIDGLGKKFHMLISCVAHGEMSLISNKRLQRVFRQAGLAANPAEGPDINISTFTSFGKGFCAIQ